jgi:hypothetical protein
MLAARQNDVFADLERRPSGRMGASKNAGFDGKRWLHGKPMQTIGRARLLTRCHGNEISHDLWSVRPLGEVIGAKATLTPAEE